MDIDLRPCPFCGGVAGLYKDSVEYSEFASGLLAQFVVVCKQCGAQTAKVSKLIYFDINGNPAVEVRGEKEPQDLWNRRVEDTNASNALEEDAISREAAIDALEDWFYSDDERKPAEVLSCLASVTPQPKVGYWTDCDDSDDYSADGYDCSVCGCNTEYATDYCPECGAKMFRPWESEDA